jgi:hypothetical protein
VESESEGVLAGVGAGRNFRGSRKDFSWSRSQKEF